MTSNGDIRTEIVESCILCGASGSQLYQGIPDRLGGVPGVWGFFRCPRDGLVWLNPRPCRDEFRKIYSAYYTHNEEEPNRRAGAPAERLRRAVYAAVAGVPCAIQSWPWRVAGRILRFFPPVREMAQLGIMLLDGTERGKLLDVGCGSGRFLAIMRDFGWDVQGIEPDSEAARTAQVRYSVPVIAANLDEAGLPDCCVDVVTMGHVLEHVYDPTVLLQHCYRVLRAGGTLVALTPNVDALGHRLFRDAWRDLDPPRHLYLFSMRTLAEFVVRGGFQIRGLRTSSRWARHIWATSRSLKSHTPRGENAPRWWHKSGGLVFQLAETAARLLWPHAGEELVLIATK